MTSYGGSRDDFPEEVVFHSPSAEWLRNTKANSFFYQEGGGGRGQRRGARRWPVKAGRVLKNTLSLGLDNLPKTLVCAL